MAAFVQHMLHHGRTDVLVAEQFLDGPDVVTGFGEVRGKGIPECVARGSFRQTGHYHSLSDGFLHEGFVNMMATLFLNPHIAPTVLLGKHPLSAPVLQRVGK